MKSLKQTLVPILLSTIWISISEFVRNTFLLHDNWVRHYNSMGLIFPEKPLNGAIWGIWSLCYAISIFIIAKRFTFFQTAILSWFIGFVLMWLVIGNMGVLPISILPIAIPLSILEAGIASYISHKLGHFPLVK